MCIICGYKGDRESDGRSALSQMLRRCEVDGTWLRIVLIGELLLLAVMNVRVMLIIALPI